MQSAMFLITPLIIQATLANPILRTAGPKLGNDNITVVSPELSYLFPSDFSGNVGISFFSTSVSQDQTQADLLSASTAASSADQTLLFVTDSAPPTYGAKLGSLGGTSGDAIYVFDLNAQGFPSNKRMFDLAERGVADGIHVDDEGRVWTGEADGIAVRNSAGKAIGLLNTLTLLEKRETKPLQNFALAGYTLVILALQKNLAGEAVQINHTRLGVSSPISAAGMRRTTSWRE